MNTINEILKSRFINKNDKPRFTKLLHYSRFYVDKIRYLIDSGQVEYSEQLDKFNLDNLQNNFFKLLYCYLSKIALIEFNDVIDETN